MLPTFTSHIIATSTLAIPVMIINETFLSFLGLELRPPAINGVYSYRSTESSVDCLGSGCCFLTAVIFTVLALNILGMACLIRNPTVKNKKQISLCWKSRSTDCFWTWWGDRQSGWRCRLWRIPGGVLGIVRKATWQNVTVKSVLRLIKHLAEWLTVLFMGQKFWVILLLKCWCRSVTG